MWSKTTFLYIFFGHFTWQLPINSQLTTLVSSANLQFSYFGLFGHFERFGARGQRQLCASVKRKVGAKSLIHHQG